MKQIRSIWSVLEEGENKAANDSIYHGSGFLLLKKIGDRVKKGEALAEVHFNKRQNICWIEKTFQKALQISEESPDYQPLIIERMRGTHNFNNI